MIANAYHLGPKLVLQGCLVGSLLVCVVGYSLTRSFTVAGEAGDTLGGPATLQASGQRSTGDLAESQFRPYETHPEPKACELSQELPQKVRRWCELITQAAEAYELPPDLIAAVIWVESGGDPSAYSRSGAVGLMQVMPRDGIASQFLCVNGPCFANRPSIEELLDPEFNIQYGSKLLARLVERHGNYREALKAYGPMKVGYSYADRVLTVYRDLRE
ncbi:MAG: transglycosylase SLT domain-containing protein [Anaerolineales bacterium]|nr:transglycosylase SLT domain-containing protein [Anaerolineales bacterium]MCS7248472.1 transglycosylase SLT domain-containing protein [Anaerolineales bacterium]MDW8162285.1 transglycosylase SLT domain-containing protein [Anaerolineales bacterium]MDW8447322.1 transglycosylase SLT domain-containing protein [Anaerolineales bacterium]